MRACMWALTYGHLCCKIVSTFPVLFWIGPDNFFGHYPDTALEKACVRDHFQLSMWLQTPDSAQWECSAVWKQGMPCHLVSRQKNGSWIFYFINVGIAYMNKVHFSPDKFPSSRVKHRLSSSLIFSIIFKIILMISVLC